MNAWLWLVVAGVFEVGMTTALKLQQQNGVWLWAFAACGVLSFQCLTKAIRTIPLGLAYAVWTGIGAVGTVLVGASVFGDALGGVQLLLLAGLVAAMVGLKLTGGSARKPESGAAEPR